MVAALSLWLIRLLFGLQLSIRGECLLLIYAVMHAAHFSIYLFQCFRAALHFLHQTFLSIVSVPLFPPLHRLVKCLRSAVILQHKAVLWHSSTFLCASEPPPCVRWAPVGVGCIFHRAKGHKGCQRTSAPEAVGVPTKAPTQAASLFVRLPTQSFRHSHIELSFKGFSEISEFCGEFG